MGRHTWIALLAVGACAQLTPEQQVVEDAAEALGGRAAVEAVTTLSFEGEGERKNLGQDLTPDATGQSFSLSDYRQSMDIPARRSRIEQTRTPTFLYFRGPDPMRDVGGVDGDVAYDVGADGVATRTTNATAEERRLGFYLYPLTAVRAAMDASSTVANARDIDGESLIDVTTADGVELTLAIDGTSKLPTRVTSMTSHPNLRDVTYEARYSDYVSVDGVMLPTQMSVSIDDYPLSELRMTAHTINGDVGDLEAPELAVTAAPIAGPPPAVVTADEVSEGVWFLAGQSHHSVLVELSDYTMLIEAPNEVRTLAVIEKARELIPDKPLTHLVSTHHHFDHSGGVRAAISEGLTIITQEANAAFYEKLGSQPSTIALDALARNPRPATIESVEDEASYGDDSMRVELYLIADNPHGSAMLMVYLPEQRLLVEADAFSPGRDFQPYAANLLENIEARKLRVDCILPIHGELVAYDELVGAVR